MLKKFLNETNRNYLFNKKSFNKLIFFWMYKNFKRNVLNL